MEYELGLLCPKNWRNITSYLFFNLWCLAEPVLPVCALLRETAARTAPTGRPGWHLDSVVKNLPWTPPGVRHTTEVRSTGQKWWRCRLRKMRHSSSPACWWRFQVDDGSYSLRVASSSPSRPAAHCDRSHTDQTGRTPLTKSRRPTCLINILDTPLKYDRRVRCAVYYSSVMLSKLEPFKYLALMVNGTSFCVRPYIRVKAARAGVYLAPRCWFLVLLVHHSDSIECNFAAICGINRTEKVQMN